MISLIVAYDKNRCIGDKNKIPWKLKSDMNRVKQLTTNQTILMGRTTFESIGRPLPNRVNRVLTSNIDYFSEGIEVYNDIDIALKNYSTEKIFVFGGSKIYEQLLPLVEEMYITEIDCEVSGDSHFPKITMTDWELLDEQNFISDENNEYNYKFLHYRRKKEIN